MATRNSTDPRHFRISESSEGFEVINEALDGQLEKYAERAAYDLDEYSSDEEIRRVVTDVVLDDYDADEEEAGFDEDDVIEAVIEEMELYDIGTENDDRS